MTLAKERIEEVVRQVVPDEDAQRIIFYLRGKTNISEFIIAEELDLEIHKTRNLLYQLLDANLVSFKRKKDKIKGWYICYWDFNEAMVPHLEETIRLETIQKLQKRLDNEDGGYFYMCRYAHARMSFEEAFEENFKCPECGDLMNQVDNNRTIDFLKSRIAELENIQAKYEEEKQAFLARRKKAAQAEQDRIQKEKEEKEQKKQEELEAKEERKRQRAENAKAKKAAEVKRKKLAAEKKAAAKKKAAEKKASTKKVSRKSTTTPKKAAKKTTKKSAKKTAVKSSKKTPKKKASTKKKVSTKKKSTKKVAKKLTKKVAKPAKKKVTKKSSKVTKKSSKKSTSKKVAKKVSKKVAKPVKKTSLLNKVARRIGGRK
jgi:transcription factor E